MRNPPCVPEEIGAYPIISLSTGEKIALIRRVLTGAGERARAGKCKCRACKEIKEYIFYSPIEYMGSEKPTCWKCLRPTELGGRGIEKRARNMHQIYIAIEDLKELAEYPRTAGAARPWTVANILKIGNDLRAAEKHLKTEYRGVDLLNTCAICGETMFVGNNNTIQGFNGTGRSQWAKMAYAECTKCSKGVNKATIDGEEKPLALWFDEVQCEIDEIKEKPKRQKREAARDSEQKTMWQQFERNKNSPEFFNITGALIAAHMIGGTSRGRDDLVTFNALHPRV